MIFLSFTNCQVHFEVMEYDRQWLKWKKKIISNETYSIVIPCWCQMVNAFIVLCLFSELFHTQSYFFLNWKKKIHGLSVLRICFKNWEDLFLQVLLKHFILTHSWLIFNVVIPSCHVVTYCNCYKSILR